MSKVITGDIQNLDISWENYSGESVEKFIKSQLSQSCGYIYRSNQKEGDFYYLYGFHSLEEYNEWAEGEDVTPLFRVQLPNIENDIFSATLSTNSNTNKLVNLGDGIKINIRYTSTSTNPSTQAVSDTYNDGTLIISRSANGSAFSEVGRILISPIEHNSTAFQTVDITQYLADGDNKIRLRVEDNVNGSVSNNINFNSIVNTTLKVTNATPVTTPLYTTTLQYYIEGQVAKTLNVNITQNGNTDRFTLPIGTSSWIEAPYFAQIDKVYDTGTIEVESWLSVDDTVLESEHIVNQFYYINGASTEDVIILNNVETDVINYANTHFFDFVVYNASTDVHILIQNGNKTYLDYTFSNCDVNTLYSFYNVLQVEEELDNIPATVTVTTNSDNQTYVINIDNTEKMSPTSGADLIINPLTRNNSEANPARIINEVSGNSLTATFNGFGFVNDGWLSDSDGIKVLRIPAEHSINISYDSFNNITNGTTIELDYKVYNIFNDDDEVIKMYSLTQDNKKLGFVMNATEAAFYTAENQTKRDQDVMFQEEVRTHMAINIIPNLANSGLNYIRIFINGVMNREMLYTNTDIFKNGDVSIVLGSDNCDLDIYSIRVYKKGLSASDVRQDYMSSIPNIEDKVAFKVANDILSANGTISYDKASVKYNTLIWTGEHPEYRTGNQEYAGTLQINIVGDPDHSGTITNLRIKGQGSSSRGYWKWNHQYDMNKLEGLTSVWTDGNGVEHTKGYCLTDEDPAATKLVAKLNWASSMQSHKIGSTALYTDVWKEVVGGNSMTRTEGYENTRVSVHEKPFLYFIKDTASSTPVFAGLMTFGSGKYDKLTFGYDKKVFPDYLIIEGSDNGMPLTNRQIPWFEDEVTYNADEEYYQYAGQGNWDYGMGNQDMLHYFIDANNFVYSHAIRIKPYTNDSELTDRTYQYWSTVDGNIVRYDYITKEWVNGGTTKVDGEYSTFNVFSQTGITPSGDSSVDNAAIIAWRTRDFKNNVSLYYNVNDVVYSMAFLKMVAASDNRCKNIYEYLDPVTHKICLAQDDMDTLMLTDNVGRKTKPYYVEEHDQNPNGGWYFNGEDSNFFTLMDAAFDSELRTMMKSILTEMSSSKYGGSVESCLQKYFFDVQEYFPAVAFNETARLLYEEAAVYQAQHIYDNGTPAISQSLGNQLEAEKQWWTRRLKYLQSWAGSDPFYVRSTTSPSLNFRSLTTVAGGNPNYQFTVTPWQWLYPKVGTGQVPGQDNTRVQARTQFTTMNLVTDGNTDTFIYGSDYYTSFGEFGDKSIGETFNLNGKRLLEFSADSRNVQSYEFRPISMTINCPVLRTLSLYGCSTLSGSLDLSKCTKLESVDLRGTGLNSVILPESDSLTTVYLPDLTSITVVNCPNITTFSVEGYTNLLSLTTDNSSLANDVISNVETLNSVDLRGIHITTTSTNVDKYIGILSDSNINCSITGSIYLAKALSNTEIEAIESKLGESIWSENNSLYITYIPVEITTVTLAASEKTIFQNDSVTISVTTDGNNVKSYNWSVDSTINLTTAEKKNSLVINSTTFDKIENITISYTITTTSNQTLTSSTAISCCNLNIHIQDFSDVEHTVVRNDYSLRNAVIDLYAEDYVTPMSGFDFTGIEDDLYAGKNYHFEESEFSGGYSSGYYFTLHTNSVAQYKVYWRFPLHDSNKNELYVYVPFYINCLGNPAGATFDTISDLTCYNGVGSTHISYTIPQMYTITGSYVLNIPSNKMTISNVTSTGFDLSINGITQSYNSKVGLDLERAQLFGSGNVTVYSYSNQFAVNYEQLGAYAKIKYNITETGDNNVLMAASTADIGNVKSMTVDGVEVTPTKIYNFTTTGTHNIEVRCAAGYDLRYLLYNVNRATEVEFGDATTLGQQICYGCSSLQKVTIKGTINSIGSDAFNGCSSLTQIYITETTKCPTVTSDTFKYIHSGSPTTSGGTVYYPDNIDFSSWFSTSLYYLGYYEWNVIYTVIDGIRYKIKPAVGDCIVMQYTYNDTYNPTISSIYTGDIVIPSTITYNSKSYTVNKIGSYCFNCCSDLTSVSMPNTITEIDNNAFYNCYKLNNITIPSSVISIKSKAFYGCKTFTTLNIPASVTNIDNTAFNSCRVLYNITVSSSNTTYKSEGNCIIVRSTNQLLLGCRNSTIPNTVRSIGPNAFNGCDLLTSITIPEGVTSIKDYAFYYCTSLTSITMPSTINDIQSSAFSTCTKLSTITINRSTAPSISSWSFGNSSSSAAGCKSGTTNVLYVPSDATGYDTTDWTAYLLNSSYGKFTLSKTL